MTTTTEVLDTRIDDALLRRTSFVLLASLIVHAIDHFVRGVDVITGLVLTAGSLQFIVAVLAVRLVVTRHPAGPMVAMLIGFGGAIGFSAAHLLPQWSTLSDPYVGTLIAPGISWFSWVSALFEIGADLAFGWAGLQAYRRTTSKDIAASATS